jgi:hypothetical protein
MAKQKMSKEEQMLWDKDWYERTHKYWRSWGSWYSWGSPIGLSIFLLTLTGIIWVLSNL